MLRLADHWVWDSWTADDGERFHLFFLKAPRSLGDLTLRHTHASVGHATSTDLTHWALQPDALAPTRRRLGRPRDLNGVGRARGDDGRWRLFCTALSTRTGPCDQRIGVALSEHLQTWARAA